MATLKVDKFPRNNPIDYKDLRGTLKNGDVLICSGSGFFSSMIQQATGSVWSHVGFVLRLDEIDRFMVLESVESIGVRTVRLSKYLYDYDNEGNAYDGGLAVIRHKNFEQLVDQRKMNSLVDFATKCFGRPYDNDEIAKIAARILASKIPFTPKQRKKIKPDGEFICSEYIARCFDKIKIPVKWNKKGFVSPADFAADPNFELVGVMKKK